ncbi:hypothetical protein I316_06842 [Kwoniella heveanensis BCC8398]|uniref:6-phosphogluconolactonase n=1 Tax=Kwoniella heveanensis BCC8398 TaxID=1296120 RepID=A0A1B9GK16_9TREE|nr:hypothetical protein I316_06842 [Kwoniella heveanensis BCC8398]
MLITSLLTSAVALGALSIEARPQLSARNTTSGSVSNATSVTDAAPQLTYDILTGADTDLFLLQFKPNSNPPSLTEKFHWPGVIRNAAYPWISRHPVNHNLFIVANDNHDLGELTSFYLDSQTGNLTTLDRVYSRGSCAHIAVSPDGGHVHIANLYGNNGTGANGAIVPIDVESGKFGSVNVPSNLNFSSYELQPGQLKASQLLRHPHHWAFHPYLPVAYLSDLGADLVRRFHIVSPGQLETLDPIKQRTASGPRRSIIHPSGRAIYTLHEIDSTLSVGSIDVTTPYGNVTLTQEGIDILPGGANHSANVFQGSEIQLSVDGRFLYAASRNNTAPPKGSMNSDPISIFSVSDNGTYIERISVVNSGAWYLRYFGLDNPYFDQSVREGQFVIAAGQYSNDTHIFKRDVINGNLTQVASFNSTQLGASSYVWI